MYSRFTLSIENSRYRSLDGTNGTMVAYIVDELLGTETRLNYTESYIYDDTHQMGYEHVRMTNIEFNDQVLYMEELKAFLNPTRSEMINIMDIFYEGKLNS